MKEKTHRAFGVEQEHFIFDDKGLAPTHAVIDRMWDSLLKDGYRVRATSPDGMVLAMERLTEDGPLVISNDSCTHILEVAFPKMNCLERFSELYATTWGHLRQRLRQFGLAIQLGGALSQAPTLIYWRPKETDAKGERLKQFLSRDPIDHPLFCREFLACFTATQVSLDIAAEEAIAKLPFFYSREYLVPLEFSTSKEFQGVRAHCIRPLAWLANFSQPYPLLGIPRDIPKTLASYRQMQAQCFGRDYSFVSIRDAHRLEFRSACSQNSLADVERLVRWRLASDQLADNSEPFAESTRWNWLT